VELRARAHFFVAYKAAERVIAQARERAGGSSG